MTEHERDVLTRRAYPVRPPLRGIVPTMIVVAVVVNAAGAAFVAWLLLAAAVLPAVRHVRRELAVGALMADANAHELHKAILPADDLRRHPRHLL